MRKNHKMKQSKFITLIFCMFAMSLIAGQFELTQQANSEGSLVFNLGEFTLENVAEFTRITNPNNGTLMEEGMPEIPVYSTFYQVKDGIEYDIDYVVHQSHILDNIHLYPTQPENKEILNDSDIIKNTDFYSSEEIYPIKNLLVSDKITMRDVKFLQVSVIPFRYYPHLQQLEVFDQVEIVINESGDPLPQNSPPISQAFEKVYESFLINYERDEEVEYQQPAVLYIGSNSALENSYFQDLVEWRKQRGYVVYTASTSETGGSTSSIKNYIQNAYNSWEPKPDFVTLIGDDGGSYSDIPTYFENLSGYNGEGDHPYTQLDGGDLMGDVFIGRMSVRNTSTLNTVCNKIINYEKATYISSTGDDWYESAALIGDPSSSGISTVITNEYAAEILNAYGFEDVNEKYSGGSWSSWMQNQLSNGVSYFNYRGYWGVSGFGSSEIEGANNGWKLPYATIITCGTGSFADDNASLSEYFFRAGTVSTPKGGIAAIGTATIGTHTAFNNAVDMGVYWGLFQRGSETAGEGLHYGKLHLYLTYPSNPNNRVSIFTHWNNLMGDAPTHLWKDIPQELDVDYPSILPMGTNFITVDVSDLTGMPVEGARVTLINNDESLFVSKLTDESGEFTFDLSYVSNGNVTLTVTKQDFIPHQGNFSVSGDVDAVNIDLDEIIFDEITGDNDGTVNPGETIELNIPLKNFGSSTIYGIQAELIAETDNISIISSTVSYGTITPGSTVESSNYTLIVDPSAIELEEVELKLQIEDGSGNIWQGMVPMEIYGARLIIENISVINDDNNNNKLEPGETGDVLLTLMNTGSKGISDISGSLYFEGASFDIIDDMGNWGNIDAGESAIAYNYFTITADNSIINGSNLTIELTLNTDDGYDRTEPLHIQVGDVSETDPLGPDKHGYYIFDSGDLDYNQAPFYDWIEIDPDYGGSGTSLGFNDSGDGNYSDSREDVTLPFDFIFYGEVYNELTVCSNGWIAFGTSNLESFRNYPIPGAGGPVNMVAAFWDDLKTSSGGQAYKYYDPADGVFIIEWSDMRTYYANSVESFQIILYDNGVPPYGDGEIKIQYKEFNNTSSGDYSSYTPTHGAYTTVGIENQYGDDGLQYTFNNVYPEAAMTLHDGDALLITTDSGQPILMGDVNQDGTLNILDVIKIVNHIINFELLDPLQQYMADLNDDGMINILDVINLIIVILED